MEQKKSRARIFSLALAGLILVAGGLTVVSYIHSDRARAERILKNCTPKNLNCSSAFISDIALHEDTGVAFRILKELYFSSPEIPPRCFDIASFVGKRMAVAQPGYRDIILKPESTFCNYGFFQTYSRERLLTTKDTKSAKDFCRYVSDSLGQVSSDAPVECYRGMGQALPFIDLSLQGDTGKMSAFAIHACEGLVPAGREREACISGLFSRLGFAERTELYGISVDIRDPLQLCHGQPKQYQEACMGNYKRAIIGPEELNPDLETEIREMKNVHPALSHADLDAIAYTFGYDTAYASAARIDYEKLLQACTYSEAVLRNRCITGLAVGLAKNGKPGEQDRQVLTLCKAVESSDDAVSTDVCPSDGALSYLKGFFSSTRFADVCREFGLYDGLCSR